LAGAGGGGPIGVEGEVRDRVRMEKGRALRTGERKELLRHSKRGNILFLDSPGILSMSCWVRLSYSVRKHRNINDGHVSTWCPIQPSISPRQQSRTPAQLRARTEPKTDRHGFPWVLFVWLKFMWSSVW
jgi:prepilin-type processing-associated H-X9-DG protein